jgi:hypothetical protein
MSNKIIRVPEHGWEGPCKKVEFKDEDVIRATFEYASLIGTDFTEAMRRALRIALPLIIQAERESQARFAACFTSYSNPAPTPTPPAVRQPQSYLLESDLVISAPKIYSNLPPEQTPTDEPPKSSRSMKTGGHLI